MNMCSLKICVYMNCLQYQSTDCKKRKTSGSFHILKVNKVYFNLLDTVPVKWLTEVFIFLLFHLIQPNTTNEGALLLTIVTVQSCHQVFKFSRSVCTSVVLVRIYQSHINHFIHQMYEVAYTQIETVGALQLAAGCSVCPDWSLDCLSLTSSSL